MFQGSYSFQGVICMIQYDIHLILASSVASAGGKGLKNGGVSKCQLASRAYGPTGLGSCPGRFPKVRASFLMVLA